MATVQTQPIVYTHGDAMLEGYLAYDADRAEPRPGVMIAPTFRGIGPYEQQRARQLAELGYVALCCDVYGQGIRPQARDEARAVMARYTGNRPLLRARMHAGLACLQRYERVDAARTAAIGYCFGGLCVLELARSGAEMAGVVSLHGMLDTPNPADAANIRCKVLVLNGHADPMVPPEHVQAFVDEMTTAGVDWTLVHYGGAVHGFTNPAAGHDPSTGLAYHAAADRRSFTHMLSFFDELFRPSQT